MLAKVLEQDLEPRRACDDLLHAAHDLWLVPFDIDLHQVHHDIGIEHVVQTTYAGPDDIVTAQLICLADPASPQMVLGISEVVSAVTSDRPNGYTVTTDSSPLMNALRRARSASKGWLERENLAIRPKPLTDHEREKPEVGT